jgi:predicted nuclease of predicted toxin-antitoxin system
MRFLSDENFPRESTLYLEQAGHDVDFIVGQFPAREDDSVLAQAVIERRILLTYDTDFGNLIYRDGQPAPPGLVLFRFPVHAPLQPAMTMLDLISRDEFNLEGMFTTVELEYVRQRRLPR